MYLQVQLLIIFERYIWWIAIGVLWLTLRDVPDKTTLTADEWFLPFCWYHGLLGLLRFHSIIKWLPVIHIWHEMSNHKSFYLSQANCSKIILLLQTTEEKKKGKKKRDFSQTERCSQDQPELSVVLLCIIVLGLLLNTVYLYDSALAGKCRNAFQFGILSFHWSIDFPETTVHMRHDNPPFKVKNWQS